MKIKINCAYEELVTIDSLCSIQGGLKTVKAKEFSRLKESIVKNGLILPIYIWRDDRDYIIDGVIRTKVLLELRNEGYSIDGVPVINIQADNLNAAKQLALLVKSKYAQVNKAGLLDFLQDINNWRDWTDEISINLIDKLISSNDATVKERKESDQNKSRSAKKEPNRIVFSFQFSEKQKLEFNQLISALKKYYKGKTVAAILLEAIYYA